MSTEQIAFPLIQEKEQNQILRSLQNFARIQLNKPKDWLYISQSVKAEGSPKFSICTYVTDYDDLYLRFGQYKIFGNITEKQLVIARIEFNKPQQGNGTALLKVLCEISEKYHYTTIRIESPNENSKNFMKAFDFDENFAISSSQLKLNIQQYEDRK